MAGKKMAGHLLGPGQVPEIFQVFRGDAVPGPVQGLIGDDVEVLGQFGLKEGQVVVAGHVEDPPLLEGRHALIGGGVVAHGIPQVQNGVHALRLDPGQDAFQRLQIAVNVGDDRQPH